MNAHPLYRVERWHHNVHAYDVSAKDVDSILCDRIEPNVVAQREVELNQRTAKFTTVERGANKTVVFVKDRNRAHAVGRLDFGEVTRTLRPGGWPHRGMESTRKISCS